MKNKNPFIVVANSLECSVNIAVLTNSLLILQDSKFRRALPGIGRYFGRAVRARIIADEYLTKLRNAGTRLNRSQCLSNRSGSIERRDDDRCAHAIITSANYFCNVIQGLI